MVHQHFMLVPVFTVAENILLGNEPLDRFRRFDRRRARPRGRGGGGRSGFPSILTRSSRTCPSACSSASRSSRRSRVMPEAAHPGRADRRAHAAGGRRPVRVDPWLPGRRPLRRLHLAQAAGAPRLADRITVLRRGRAIGTVDAATAEPQELANMMVGRPVVLVVDRGPAEPGEPVLTVEGLEVVEPDGSGSSTAST
jgi:general nucleoside transport system ATP-binding protein